MKPHYCQRCGNVEHIVPQHRLGHLMTEHCANCGHRLIQVSCYDCTRVNVNYCGLYNEIIPENPETVACSEWKPAQSWLDNAPART